MIQFQSLCQRVDRSCGVFSGKGLDKADIAPRFLVVGIDFYDFCQTV